MDNDTELDIISIEETDDIGWLSYSNEWRVASYGHTKEDSIWAIESCIEDVRYDPEYDPAEAFCIPDENWPFFGDHLIEIVAGWIGEDHEIMKSELRRKLN